MIRRVRRKNYPVIIGLTGSIGMGKSTVAEQLAYLGAKICGADAVVHRLMQKGGAAVPAVARLFPQAALDGAVDRRRLGDIVFKDKEKLAQLERVLHPLVVAAENRFVARARRLGARLVVLEIPLLFETGAERRCHRTITVTAPGFLQKKRVMKRPGMTAEKLSRILAAQLPDREKRRRADHVVRTGLGKAASFRSIKMIIDFLHF